MNANELTAARIRDLEDAAAENGYVAWDVDGDVHITAAATVAAIDRAGIGADWYGIKLDEALTLNRIPWSAIIEAGYDLREIATEAAEHADITLYHKAMRAIKRHNV